MEPGSGRAYFGRFFFFVVVSVVFIVGSVDIVESFAIGSVEFIGIALGSVAGVAGVVLGSAVDGSTGVVPGGVVVGACVTGGVLGVVCASAAVDTPIMAILIMVAIRMVIILLVILTA